MAFLGNIKNKKEARKHLIESGTLPDSFQMKMVVTLEQSEANALKRVAFLKWPFAASLLCNAYLIWRLYE
jgi:hypothetical protein